MLQRLPQMLILDALVREQGFSAAARRLGVSKSYISKQLAQLEASLGAQLVQRTTRRFALTELGEDYARHCRALVIQAQEADSMVAERQGRVSGVLHLGIGQSFGRLHVVPRLQEFQRNYPELELEVSLFDRRSNLVDEGLDLWITTVEDKPEGLVGQRLADIGFVVVASPDYLLQHGTPLTPQDLQHHNCITYQSQERRYDQWQFRRGRERLAVPVSGNYRVDLAEAVRDAALAGLGIAYVANYLLEDELRQGRLIPLFPEWEPSQKMAVHAVYARREHLPPKVRHFIAFLKEIFGHPPHWEARQQPWLGRLSLTRE
ncbi:LysR family transcriptional regulator [Aeromonas diversa]|uniref:LysR family transcriptional regulator n=1 Tax=Aeromonas diversa CDC 2478-85 TaxID=1268237 RepID=N9V8M6_9GAMM|nr:LysR family transcriptional regulator [Aeromonas diversa]ENY71627.1 LysR family transcriptional regulator [Aeromonas diversa CDC 2478-85]